MKNSLGNMEDSLGILMFEPILRPDSHNSQDQFGRTFTEAKCRDMYEWNMRVEPLKV